MTVEVEITKVCTYKKVFTIDAVDRTKAIENALDAAYSTDFTDEIDAEYIVNSTVEYLPSEITNPEYYLDKK